MSIFKESEDKYIASVQLNHQGFQLGSTVPPKDIKMPLFLLMRDVDCKKYEKSIGKKITTKDLQESKFVLFSIWSLPTASKRFKWIATAKPESDLEVLTINTYGGNAVTLGSIREFDVEKLNQFVPHIKEIDECLLHYPQWRIYFPERKLVPEDIVKTNPMNIAYIRDLQTKTLVNMAVELEGESVQGVEDSLLDESICAKACEITPIAYRFLTGNAF